MAFPFRFQTAGVVGRLQTLVKLFTTPEIIGYPVENQELLEADPSLSAGGPELLAK